jgi:hypothetical protein
MGFILLNSLMKSLVYMRRSDVQGDRLCDVCKKEIKNLPELPPRSADSDPETIIDMLDDTDHTGHPHGLAGPFMGEVPGSADVVFDLIRVCPPPLAFSVGLVLVHFCQHPLCRVSRL